MAREITEKLDFKNISKDRIKDKYPNNEFVQEWGFKFRDAYMQKFDGEYPLIKDVSNTVDFQIEFREGKYNSLVWVENVTLNHQSELATKAELMIIKLLSDEKFNVHDEIRWTADEFVTIKNVENGRFYVR